MVLMTSEVAFVTFWFMFLYAFCSDYKSLGNKYKCTLPLKIQLVKKTL